MSSELQSKRAPPSGTLLCWLRTNKRWQLPFIIKFLLLKLIKTMMQPPSNTDVPSPQASRNTDATTFKQKFFAFWSSDPSSQEYHLRNVIHVSAACFFLFTAFKGTENLASSFLGRGLGNISMAIVYVVTSISCFFAPAIVHKIGVKYSLELGGTGICAIGSAYLLAVVYHKNTPFETNLRWASVLSASVIIGFTAAPFWVAQGMYLTESAKAMFSVAANKSGETKTDSLGSIPMMGFVSGIFWFLFKLTSVSAGIIASTLASSTAAVFGAYLGCAVLGVVAMTFLRATDPKHASPGAKLAPAILASSVTSAELKKGSARESISSLVKLWLDPRLLAISPMVAYAGLQSGWVFSTFNSDYVAISLGRPNIGFMITIYGALGAVFSLASGKLSDCVGRLTVLLIGASAQLIASGMILFGEPVVAGGGQWALIVTIAALWSLGGATLNTGLSAIMGEIFFDQRDAAFANLKLLQSIACAVSFLFPVLGLTARGQTLVLAIVCIVGSIAVVCVGVFSPPSRLSPTAAAAVAAAAAASHKKQQATSRKKGNDGELWVEIDLESGHGKPFS
jgi:MFS family permease